MLLKFFIGLAVRVVFDIIHTIYKIILLDGTLRRKAVGVVLDTVLTFLMYLIFKAVDFKHPIIWTVLLSPIWGYLSFIIAMVTTTKDRVAESNSDKGQMEE